MSEITDKDGVSIARSDEEREAAIEDGVYDSPEMRDNAEREQSDGDDDDRDEDLADKMAEMATLFKYRVYVDDPSEVPADYEVQQGPQGGYYYEVEGEEGAAQDEEAEGAEGGGEEEGGVREAWPVAPGVWADIQPLDTFDADTWPDEGEEVMIDGELYEAAGHGGPITGPDGKEYLKIQYGNDTMTVQWDAVAGSVRESWNAGEYDVETEWGLRFADSLNSGEWGEQGAEGFMGVRDIQHHASDVQNPEVLVDGILAEQDARGSVNAVNAMKSRLRALGEDPSALLPDPDPGETAGFAEDEYESWESTFDPDPEDATPLYQYIDEYEGDLHAGVTAANMAVQEVEGEDRRAFVSDYSGDLFGNGGLKDLHRDEQIVLGNFARKAGLEGSVVPIAHDEENGEWTAVKEFGDGVEAGEVDVADSDWFEKADPDDVLDKFATMVLGGASDLHNQNVMVGEDGRVGFHDLDHVGARLSFSERTDEEDSYNRTGAAAATMGQIISHSDYDDLPEEVQNRTSREEYEEQAPYGYQRHAGDQKGLLEAALSDRIEKKAVELVEESDSIEDYTYDPDEGYANDQDDQNDLIRDNMEHIYEQATGRKP